jgi:cyclohexanone monooxygenase
MSIQTSESSRTADVIVVGAGFGGLYMLHKMRAMGMRTVCFEAGGDVGGTWYWNRYPGARCDVESLQYCYSFDEALQQQWQWTERYPEQPEILSYINHVAERFDLRRDIRFDTTVTAAHFVEASGAWQVTTDKDESYIARFLVMATGALSAARHPDIPGLDTFTGKWYHTGRWPHEPVDFTGRRVAVVGTGSSGIQAIPVIAKAASQVYVFQRTANFSIPAWNRPLAADAQRDFKAHYSEHRARAKATRSGILYDYSQRSALSVSEDERRAEYEARWARGGANFTHAFNDIFRDRLANDTAAEFVRSKIRSIVKNPDVAERLVPKDHAIGTKRICVDTDYYATFNRRNVELVDVRRDPIVGIGPTQLQTRERSFDVDRIVFATGYDAVTGSLIRIDIRGRDGVKLADRWRDGPRTYLGLTIVGFPNLFTITGPGSPSVLTNVIMAIEQHVEWVSECIAHMKRIGVKLIEATRDAEDDWGLQVEAVARATLFADANSWYTGANIPGKPRVFLPYVGGLGVYTEICSKIAAAGYTGFQFS